MADTEVDPSLRSRHDTRYKSFSFLKICEIQRMEAVKRAYAKIILNTAVESAARILALERKAMGF